MYLHAADIFLLTSDTEGIPGALLEAMTVGLPSIVTDVGGISEVLDDDIIGVLTLPDDEEAMVDRVPVTSDVGWEASRTSGGCCPDRRSQAFHTNTCAEEYEAFYRSILDRWANGQTARQIGC